MTETRDKKTEQKAGPTSPARPDGQNQLWKSWQDAWNQAAEQWQKAWSAGPLQIPAMQYWTRWNEIFMKPFSEIMQQKPEGIGPEVFAKVLNASMIYSKVMEFWQQALAALISIAQGKPDADSLKKVSEKWIEEYQEVMKTVWGAAPSEAQKQMINSLGITLKTQLDAFFNFLSPVFADLDKIPEKIQAATKGEPQGLLDLFSIFRKDYEQTIGKIFRMPAMGYFSALQERANHMVDSYIEFLAVLNEYYSLFYETGGKAMEKIIGRLSEFKDEDWSDPESQKKFYRLWLQMNEDAYHELFLSPQFINLLREVLTRGLEFRKWTDELYDKLIEATPLPSKKDMDEVYHAIYELKKEVRSLQKKLEQAKGSSGETE